MHHLKALNLVFFQEWKRTFDHYDADRSGTIDNNEVSLTIQSGWEAPAPKTWSGRFNGF